MLRLHDQSHKLEDKRDQVDHYSRQEKPSPALVLSKDVFEKPLAHQVAAVKLSEVTVVSFSCLWECGIPLFTII